MTLAEVKYLIAGAMTVRELTGAPLATTLRRYGLTLANPDGLPESPNAARNLPSSSIYRVVSGSLRPDDNYKKAIAGCVAGWPELDQTSREFLEAKYRVGQGGGLEFGDMPATLFKDYQKWFFALRGRVKNPVPKTVVVSGVNVSAQKVADFLKSDAPTFVHRTPAHNVPQATWARPALLAGGA